MFECSSLRGLEALDEWESRDLSLASLFPRSIFAIEANETRPIHLGAADKSNPNINQKARQVK